MHRRRRGYEARLDIVGSGELKEALRRQIAAAGLDDRVRLLGPRPQEELIDLYCAATIVALPGTTLPEAMTSASWGNSTIPTSNGSPFTIRSREAI